jgi:nucleoside-diphosphate-sugar epimerase
MIICKRSRDSSAAGTGSLEKRDSVLITGASGFIGRHLVPELHRRGFEVVAHSSAEGDIANSDLSYENVSHVFHLAGLSFVPDSWIHTRDYYRTNLLGTINILEFCRRTGASLTLMSTYVYGQPERLPIDENHPVHAFNPYSHTKILAEETARYYGNQFGIQTAIIRSFNSYGFGQSDRFLIPKLLTQALDPDRAEITIADARPRRDYIYISDLIALLVLTMERRATGTYNAGSGVSTSIAEILDHLWSIGVPRKPLISENKPRTEEVLDIVADISKARRELGWTPRVQMREGLAAILDCLGKRD